MKNGKHGSVEIYIDGEKVFDEEVEFVELPPEYEQAQRIHRAHQNDTFNASMKSDFLELTASGGSSQKPREPWRRLCFGNWQKNNVNCILCFCNADCRFKTKLKVW